MAFALFVGLLVSMLGTALTRADAACPSAEGWTRLVGQADTRRPDEPSAPWEREPLINGDASLPRIRALAAGWEAPGVLYVGGSFALYRSWDCGATWETVWTPEPPVGADRGLASIHQLVAGPGGRLYGGVRRSIAVSNNAGASWFYMDQIGELLGLDISVLDPNTAYIFGWNNGGPGGSHDA
jgi:hypothetical protein